MDVKAYFRRVEAKEEEIGEAEVLVVSEETADGGRAGVMVEVARAQAARLIVEGRFRLATAEERRAGRAPRGAKG